MIPVEEVNRQITVILVTQTIIPLVTTVIPAGLTDLSVFLNLGGYELTARMSFSPAWIGVLNPVVVIMIVRPYRRYLRKLVAARLGFAVSLVLDGTGGGVDSKRANKVGTIPAISSVVNQQQQGVSSVRVNV